jgi:hypothetical protein
MAPGVEEDDDNMAWNNDWDDDDDSIRGLESQQILQENEDHEIEDEIRANLNSKITSSLHAYKVAGIALIITLISFTINTVPPLDSVLILGIRTIRTKDVTLGKTILYAVILSLKGSNEVDISIILHGR